MSWDSVLGLELSFFAKPTIKKDIAESQGLRALMQTPVADGYEDSDGRGVSANPVHIDGRGGITAI